MNNISKAFAEGKSVIPFITCGDPDLDTTGKIIRESAKNGAGFIVLGIPFSDPTAEGPVIQEANLRALAGGATTDRIFDFLKELRKDVSVPLVFMTYANVVFSYGAEKFISLCAETGISGIIVPDLPFEEKEEFLPVCEKYDVDLVSQIASTSAQRIPMIAEEAKGFLLADAGNCYEALEGMLSEAAKHTDIPRVAAADTESIEEMVKISKFADGIIVRKMAIRYIEQYGKKAPEHIGAIVRMLNKEI